MENVENRCRISVFSVAEVMEVGITEFSSIGGDGKRHQPAGMGMMVGRVGRRVVREDG